MTVTLYHFPGSAPSRAVLMTLLNLGIEFDSKLVNLPKGENKTPAFTELNPQRTVPVVEDDDVVISESRAIMAYLVDKHSPENTLYPSDPKARYIINHRLYYDATIFSPRIMDTFYPIMFKGETIVDAKRKEKLLDSITTLESFLDGQEWFSCSENPSLADISLLASFSTIYHGGLDISNFPNLTAWYERCSSLPGYNENEKGAKMMASAVKSKLTEPF